MFFLQDSGQLIVLLSTEFGTWSSKVYKLRSIGNNCENLCPPLVNYLLSNRLVTVIIVGCSCNCSLLLHLCHNCSSCLRCLLGGHMVDLVSYLFQKLRNHHIVKQSQCFIDLPPRWWQPNIGISETVCLSLHLFVQLWNIPSKEDLDLRREHRDKFMHLPDGNKNQETYIPCCQQIAGVPKVCLQSCDKRVPRLSWPRLQRFRALVWEVRSCPWQRYRVPTDMHSPETPMREPDQDTSNSSSAPAAQQQQFCNNKQTNRWILATKFATSQDVNVVYAFFAHNETTPSGLAWCSAIERRWWISAKRKR